MKKEFYLQNSCSYLGNSMTWWAKSGGYTTDLCEAKTFTKDEAMAQHLVRASDIPWPVTYIHGASRLVVDRQDVRAALLESFGLELHLEPREPLCIEPCPTCGRTS